MYYLVSVAHKSMALQLTRIDCQGFYGVLYIQFIGWDWYWCVVEWQWRQRECWEWHWLVV